MIKNRDDLKMYLALDKQALSIERKRPRMMGEQDFIWRFQIVLRKYEYHLNQVGSSFAGQLHRVCMWYYKIRHYQLGLRGGYCVPPNVFGPGLRINHTGLLVVSSKAKVGAFCDIHQGVNIGIGLDMQAPQLGDNVWIGPGAKLFGGIEIGSDIMIGANSVVNKSFDSNVRIAGVPAKIISNDGNLYHRESKYK